MDLNNENFLLYAANNYISPHFVEYEFFNDLKRIKYIKRLLFRYSTTGNLKERLILNHIISIYNSFVLEAATRMLFLKINQYSYLKTFLIYLNYMPEIVKSIKGINIYSSDILIDNNIANILRKL